MQRLVDIFSGCGGLSLGFDLSDGANKFRTCLAIDNEVSTTRLFNHNFSELKVGHAGAVARCADVCWFDSAAEIRLFYLTHIARLEHDTKLKTRLLKLGFGRALSQIKQLDASCQSSLSELGRDPGFAAAASKIDPATYHLATVKRMLRLLGLRSFNRAGIDPSALPWSEECAEGYWGAVGVAAADVSEVERNVTAAPLWDAAISALSAGSEKVGRGQHAGNAKRYGVMLEFLSSPWGRQAQQLVEQWRAARAALMASFVERTADELEALYQKDYQVAGLLGGPPCKGFSRIGRPVANALRQQGVFTWTSDAFGDERNKLMLHYVLFLEAFRPHFFVFENVSNFQSSLKTPNGVLKADELLAEAVSNLSDGELDYDVAARQVTASDFGVPQNRIRFLMVGVDTATRSAPADEILDLPQFDRSVSVSEAFWGLPPASEFRTGRSVDTGTEASCSKVSPPASDEVLEAFFAWVQQPLPGKKVGGTDGHIFRAMRPDDEAFFQLMGPGVRWMDWEVRSSPTLEALKVALKGHKNLSELVEGNLALRLILEDTKTRHKLAEQHLLHSSYMKNRSGSHGDWMERLAGDRPAKTVVAHIGKDTYGYIHPYETRPITVREAARLQSFPDAFSFATAGVVDAYTAIGNAVPPMLANALARRISTLVDFQPRRSELRQIAN